MYDGIEMSESIVKCGEFYLTFASYLTHYGFFLFFFFFKNGDKTASPSELTCPPGWEWEDDAWVYDINRAVDERGNISDLLPDQGLSSNALVKVKFPWEGGVSRPFA